MKIGEVFRPRLVREVKLLGPLSRSIRSVECKLCTKIITRINGNCEMSQLSLINPSSEIVYYSTTLFNHQIIRLVRFVLKINVGVVE
jgi:hypothetical protein